MTKEDKIKEAYGDAYEPLKGNINIDNGFVYVQVIARQRTDGTEYENFGFDIKQVELDFSASIFEAHFKWRPKSLTGIEDNNGWTKIDSSDDLPADEGMYLFRLTNGSNIELYHSHDISRASVTHWRPITKIPNPIY